MNKSILITSAIIILVLAAAYFTKPVDTEIINKVQYLPLKDSVLDKELTYHQYAVGEPYDRTIDKGVSTEDRIFFKIVSLKIGTKRQMIGKAYFGKLHYTGWRDEYLNSFPISQIPELARQERSLNTE